MHHHPSQWADQNSPQAFRATMPELVSQYKEVFSGKEYETGHTHWKLWE